MSHRLRFSILALLTQLGVGVEDPAQGLASPVMTPVMIGEDYIEAVCLLLAIFGLAAMPTMAGTGGGGTLCRRSPNAAAVDGALRTASKGASDRGAAPPAGQLEEYASKTNGPGTPKDHEQGVQDRQSTSLLAATHRNVLSGKGAAPAASTSKPSTLLFVLNFVLWIGLAVAFSGYSKRYLRDTHDPLGLLVLQGATGVVVLCALSRLGALDVNSPGGAGRSTGLLGLLAQLIVASRRCGLAAVLHTAQALLTNFSVFVGGVAATNALKAMEPVAAAIFSYFLLGKTVSSGKMASLGWIVGGILLLTSKSHGGGHGQQVEEGGGAEKSAKTEGAASPILVSAIFTVAAVCCNALRNVLIKRSDPIPPHQTLLACSSAAAAVGVTMMVLRLMFRSMDELLERSDEVIITAAAAIEGAARTAVGGAAGASYIAGHHSSSWLSMDGVNAALCFVGYNFASFNLLASLSPVGHAVGNSVKRVVMFAAGILFLGEVMTGRQLGGTAVALFGVAMYNMAASRK